MVNFPCLRRGVHRSRSDQVVSFSNTYVIKTTTFINYFVSWSFDAIVLWGPICLILLNGSRNWISIRPMILTTRWARTFSSSESDGYEERRRQIDLIQWMEKMDWYEFMMIFNLWRPCLDLNAPSSNDLSSHILWMAIQSMNGHAHA